MAAIHAFIESTTRWLVASFGPFGLFLIAFCDSSFLSLPEVNDILIVTLSIREPERFWVFALFTAAGSVVGSSALYLVGRKGIQALLRLRLSPQRIGSLRSLFRRFDVLAVLVPALLPPPCPFKTFVLASGAFGMPFPRFVVAVAIGRTMRYMAEGWLAVRYGDVVLRFIERHVLNDPLGAGLVGLLVFLAIALATLLVRRLTRSQVRPTGAVD